MTISPISSSMMSMYVPVVAGKGAEIDYEYEIIKQKLALYGISPSGDKNTDKMKLETAERMAEIMQAQSSMATKQSVPFEDVMNTLNLSITGDLEKDYETTIDKLDHEIGMAYNEEDKAYYQALKDEVEADYISAKENRQSYVGANQIASMNKYILLGLY